jgi:pyridoxine/pyridoxamine 5'-phosphate oxidase
MSVASIQSKIVPAITHRLEKLARRHNGEAKRRIGVPDFVSGGRLLEQIDDWPLGGESCTWDR